MFLNQGRLILSLLVFCNLTQAGTFGLGCNPRVSIPCISKGTSIGAEALYLNPSHSDPSYSVSVGTHEIFKSRIFWQWGFNLKIRHYFGSGNDVSANWYHWNNSKHKNFNGIFIVATANTLGNPTVSLQSRWDAANFEFGQRANFGANWTTRFFGGAHYVDIQNNGNFAGRIVSSLTDSSSTSINKSYIGGGPRIGMDLMYGRNFFIYSKTATSILVGNSKYYNSIIYTSVTNGKSATSVNIIVPEIEEKLGLQYNFALPKVLVNLDLGWLWVEYFKPFETPMFNPPNSTSLLTTQNFGLQGLYFGFNVIFNN